MLTKVDIQAFLEKQGVKRSDTVLVHTSMRALGEVEGGCDGLINAFCEYLSDGLFLVPTHTWDSVGKEMPVYDVRVTPPCLGALPTVAAFRADGVRSLHPTHSVVAFGKRAREFVAGEEKAVSPCSAGGVWQRLLDEKATVLLLGVDLTANTYIHAVDEMLNLPHRLLSPVPLTVIDEQGGAHSLLFSKHAITGSRFFENYRKPLEQLGALRTDSLNGATVGIFDVVRATEILKLLWQRADYNLCGEKKEIPPAYYSAEI